MFDMHRVQLDWGGRNLTLETGRIARQADGAVLATYGETSVLAAVVAAKQPKEGIDFLPLTVNYTEKYYAAGRIPGGYFKRERGPTEKDTLTSRLIDRPIRPLFADGWRCDTQVTITVLSHDQENDPDIVAMVAASAALTLSGARNLNLEHMLQGQGQPDLGVEDRRAPDHVGGWTLNSRFEVTHNCVSVMARANLTRGTTLL